MSTIAETQKSATTFFWRCLIGATMASIAGNVAHALYGHGAVAAVIAAAPPLVLCAAVHGLSWMVRTQIVGRYFLGALSLMLGVGICALVLSFHALFELAVNQGGIPPFIAWLWPMAIDLSVTFSTLALLALTTGKRARRDAAVSNRAPRKRVARPKPKAVKAVAEMAA